MALPVQNLDDRTFQDLVNEARSKIPQYCPEWTDHNLSDPGITLIELFAWMTELIIYRLNRVPDKNYVKFLDLIGVRLTPGNPARTEITFRLTAPTSETLTIPRGVEVATVRTETQNAIVFTTDEDLSISVPRLDHFLTTPDGNQFEDRIPLLEEMAAGQDRGPGQGDAPPYFSLFQDVPQPGNTFYLGYGSDLRGAVLLVNFGLEDIAVVGVNPDNPPLLWEYWDGADQDWNKFERQPESQAWLDTDATQGLNSHGQVLFHLPRTAGLTTVGLREGYWIRCQLTPFSRSQGSYESSPRLRTIESQAVGGLVAASNITRQVGEVLGTSDGKTGQVMKISQVPILPLGPGETVEVEAEDNSGWEAWEQVSEFSQSGVLDRHFECDPVSGEVRFGPAIRSPNGDNVRHGAVPPRGSRVRLTSYRHGAGPQGNVGRKTLRVLKSSIPYVASVTNRRSATGGVEPEDIENAKMRGPQALRTLHRAVTAGDFEFLAKEASPSVGRAHCLQPQETGQEGAPPPGVVQVLLVPNLPRSDRRLTPEDLAIPADLLKQVKEYLDERRLLSVALTVSEPEYTWVAVEARVNTRPGTEIQVKQAIEEQLYRFINPVHGGGDGSGWAFGRGLFDSELSAQIQSVPGVNYIENLKVFPVDPTTGVRGEAIQSLSVPASGLLCSLSHSVTCF